MANPEEPEDEEPKKKTSKLPLIIGLVLSIVGGGGGFYAVQSGFLFGGESQGAEQAELGHAPPSVTEMPDVAFVPVEPLVVSLDGKGSHLRFRAQLEVDSAYKGEVERLMPRVVDVLNNYLRALDVEDLSNSRSLARLRAQMLRRVQIVTGGGRVSDLLIMEFVLN